MIIKFLENIKKNRFRKMEDELPKLNDDELKSWYNNADVSSLLGNACEHELKLKRKIEIELNNRGFIHMKDY